MSDRSKIPASTDAVMDFRYVVSPGMPRISISPGRINAATVEKLLGHDEELISWGTLPRSIYFAFDTALLIKMFLGLMVLTFAYCFMSTFSMWLAGSPYLNLIYDLPKYFLICYFSWLTFSHIRRASYIITSKRMLRIAQFVHEFHFEDLPRAVRHEGSSNTEYIEFYAFGGVAPSLILETRPASHLVASLPLSVETTESQAIGSKDADSKKAD